MARGARHAGGIGAGVTGGARGASAAFIAVATGALACLAAMNVACSSVGSSAIATGPVRLAPRSGPVAIYVAETPPPNSQDLGVVEVHASQNEGNIETLFPVFAQRVAGLGGNGAVIEGVRAHFDLVTYMRTESYSYPCGRYTCTGLRSYPVTEEVMTVTMHGHAVLVPGGP